MGCYQMIIIVTFHFLMLLPGMTEPLKHAEQVPTLEQCIGMVADASMRARTAQRTGTYQAGCTITIPQIVEH
jgi:hypothetical protein